MLQRSASVYAFGRASNHRSTSARRQPTAREPRPPCRTGRRGWLRRRAGPARHSPGAEVTSGFDLSVTFSHATPGHRQDGMVDLWYDRSQGFAVSIDTPRGRLGPYQPSQFDAGGTGSVKRILQETARSDPFTGPTPITLWGHGKVDAYEALMAARLRSTS